MVNFCTRIYFISWRTPIDPTSRNWTEINRLKVYRITIILRQRGIIYPLCRVLRGYRIPFVTTYFNLMRQSLIIRWFPYLVLNDSRTFYIPSTTYSYSLTIPLIPIVLHRTKSWILVSEVLPRLLEPTSENPTFITITGSCLRRLKPWFPSAAFI